MRSAKAIEIHSQSDVTPANSNNLSFTWSMAFDQVYFQGYDGRDITISGLDEIIAKEGAESVVLYVSSSCDWTLLFNSALIETVTKSVDSFMVTFDDESLPSLDQLETLQNLSLQSLDQDDEKYLLSIGGMADEQCTKFLRSQLENLNLKRALTLANGKLTKVNERLKKQERELITTKAWLNKANDVSRMLRRSTSFRLGKTLLEAIRSPVRFMKLPLALWELYRQGEPQRVARKIRKFESPVTERRRATAPAKIRDIKLSVEKVAPELLAAKLSSASRATLRVAGIMDEFTRSSYAPECELLELAPNNVREQLDRFKPNLVFIESAWKGKDENWKGKVSTLSPEIVAVIEWAREHHVATIMWNKEDPVHFTSFLPLANIVDYVFTTDVDCVPAYREALGHDRVKYLGFAAQPKIHNPVEKYQRLDRFCFAGSYYLRYPERQRDFESIVSAAFQFKPVDIYDRNYDNPHPHYLFPEHYRGLIKGSLPFDKIDKAYKGYRYGINLNTIKQSQSMFARRVYELAASNTIVVSNYSRGVENVFGDRVLCSDDQTTLEQRLTEVVSTDEAYKRFRLEALRFVLDQHLYRHRLDEVCQFICGDLTTTRPDISNRSVVIVAEASSEAELSSIQANIGRQQGVNVEAHIIVAHHLRASSIANDDGFVFHSSEEEFNEDLNKLISRSKEVGNDWLAVMSPSSYYGEHYCLDLLLSREYSNSKVFTKHCYLDSRDGDGIWVNPKLEYTYVDSFDLERSLVAFELLDELKIERFSQFKTSFEVKALSIDGLNYNRYASAEGVLKASEGVPPYNGVHSCSKSNFNATETISQDFERERFASDSKVFDAYGLHSVGLSSADGITVKTTSNNQYELISSLGSNSYRYLYLDQIFTREELNFHQNSQYLLKYESSIEDLRMVIEFLDENKKKLSHQMNRMEGAAVSVAVPFESKFYRVGFRLQGAGSVRVSELAFGKMVNVPASIVSASDTLVLAKQYPSYSDIYRYGFLHSRLKGYAQKGSQFQMFRFTNEAVETFRHYDGVSIAQGDASLLDRTLSSGQYKQVLVHLLDRAMWEVLKKHLNNVKVIIWAHGAEIQLWQRREFEFERMSDAEIQRQKKLSDQRLKFWNEVLGNAHPNVHTVFVSKYFKNEVAQDFGLNLLPDTYSIIPNYIDSGVFEYVEKSIEQRCKILSIRPYASRKYANDLSVSAVLELSKRDCFQQLSFLFVGDGPLFEETLAPLRAFPNVKIQQGFLTQSEIAKLHQSYGVFLTPTRMDSQGVSRDEAMSSGLVPVTNGVTAIPEFVDDTCGMVVPGEDYIAMADAIELLVESPQLFQSLSIAAHRRASSQSGYNATIGKELNLILGEL